MEALLASIALVAAEIFKYVGTIATTITTTPLLLLTVGFLVIDSPFEQILMFTATLGIALVLIGKLRNR